MALRGDANPNTLIGKDGSYGASGPVTNSYNEIYGYGGWDLLYGGDGGDSTAGDRNDGGYAKNLVYGTGSRVACAHANLRADGHPLLGAMMMRRAGSAGPVREGISLVPPLPATPDAARSRAPRRWTWV